MEDREPGQGVGAQPQRPVGQYQSTLGATGVRRRNGGRSRDKAIITKNCLNLTKTHRSKKCYEHWIEKKKKHENTTRHIIIKLLKTSAKEKIVRAAEKQRGNQVMGKKFPS